MVFQVPDSRRRLIRQLKKICQASGWSIEDGARRANLHLCVVAVFDRGGMNFRMLTRGAIARALGAQLGLEVKRTGTSFLSQKKGRYPSLYGEGGAR